MELDPKFAPSALMLTTMARSKKGDQEAALIDANRRVELDPTSAHALLARANVKSRLKRQDEALEDSRKAVELAPTDPIYHLNYAYFLSRSGDYAGARREMDEAARLGSRSAAFYNNLAWILATADDDKIRDGVKAEEAINEAMELLPNQGNILDTKAAVCAELGRFEEAVKWQKRYLSLKTLTSEQRKNGQHRLELYQKHQPFRQTPGL